MLQAITNQSPCNNSMHHVKGIYTSKKAEEEPQLYRIFIALNYTLLRKGQTKKAKENPSSLNSTRHSILTD
jgi:hypothetical protein